MIFAILLAIVAAAVASAAAYFSVYGLALLFSGIAIPVIIMGVALEAGKLMAASFLYRFWDTTSLFLKSYLMFAIFVLMVITSMGIFGFLTGAYQKQSLPLETTSIQLELKQEELDLLISRKAAIDKQISDMPATYVSAKQRLIASFDSELDRINDRIPVLQQQILEQKGTTLEVEAKIGPILFVAETLGVDKGLTIFAFVLIIVLVFDPLAVALTIAANIAFANYKKPKSEPTVVADPIAVTYATPMAAAATMQSFSTVVDGDNPDDEMGSVVAHDIIPDDHAKTELIDHSRVVYDGESQIADNAHGSARNYVDITPVT